MKPIVYLAGPMRGYADNNFPAFFEAEEVLRGLGYGVVNPARLDTVQVAPSFEFMVRRDLNAVINANGIALLQNWFDSKGARAEAAVANWMAHWAIFQQPDKTWSLPDGSWNGKG